jgi:hypothetical protein
MDGGRIKQQALDAQRVRDSHWMGPGLSRLRGLLQPQGVILMLLVLAACHYEYHDCPDQADLYIPTGPVIEDGCDCPDGVPLACSAACAGPAVTTCEEPARLEAFLNGAGKKVTVRHTVYLDSQALVLECE